MNEKRGWIGVDLDGTLAEYHGWVNTFHIGAPIPAMVERIKAWLAEGKDVRIFTARVDGGEVAGSMGVNPEIVERYREVEQIVAMIQDWCEQHIGARLPVTCKKDYGMVELWDDRACQVIPNTGECVADRAVAAEKRCAELEENSEALSMAWLSRGTQIDELRSRAEAAEAERDSARMSEGMADGCLDMIRELLASKLDMEHTPPMMYPEAIMTFCYRWNEILVKERDAARREVIEEAKLLSERTDQLCAAKKMIRGLQSDLSVMASLACNDDGQYYEKLWRQQVKERDAARADAAKWQAVIGARLVQVVPPEGEEVPVTPEYVVGCLDELQEEWDCAERRLAKSEADAAALREKIIAHRKLVGAALSLMTPEFCHQEDIPSLIATVGAAYEASDVGMMLFKVAMRTQEDLFAALAAPNLGQPLLDELARLRAALTEIRQLAYTWTMREPLEIVTHGGCAHAAPVGDIYQHADAALAPTASKPKTEEGKS